MVDGVIVSAESTEATEMLGQFLIGRGLVDEDQVRRALEIQESAKVFFGGALVKMGALLEADLERALVMKTEEIIYSLFDWDEGTFEFEPSTGTEDLATRVKLEIENVLERGAVRQQELKQIREVFPDPRLVPKLERDPSSELLQDPMAQRVRRLVDGRRSVGEIVLGAHGSEHSVGRHLFAFFSDGALLVLAPERAETEVQAAGPSLSLEEGDRLLHKGRFGEALEIYRSAMVEGIERRDLEQLVQGTERLILDQAYRHELPPNAVLQRVLRRDQILASDISPRHFFLVEAIDGKLTVKEIVRSCPLPEVDTLLLLKDLLELRMIKVVESWS